MLNIVELRTSEVATMSQLPTKDLSLDNVIRRLVKETPDRVLIAYPSRSRDFQPFTAVDIDRLTRAVISVLPEFLRTPMNETSPGERPVVAVVGIEQRWPGAIPRDATE